MVKFLTRFLDNYHKNHILRAHMPGHKGNALSPEFQKTYANDITEISGADSLFEAEGILRRAEQQTAEIYQTPECCWSAGGSTLCIQAMLARMKAEQRTVIAARTVHRAFLNSCILLDLPVKWVFPAEGGIISGTYRIQDFEAALQSISVPACIYITSPDYAGNLQDIAGLSALCRKYQAKLLVDNAHGAHLAFLEENLHPIALGADFCCDSAHKTLPALTGGAFLHMKNPELVMQMKQYMQMFGSTSPSYLIMQSLEFCTEWLTEQGREAVSLCVQHIQKLKQKFSGKYLFLGSDPLHLTISTNGEIFAEQLRNCPYPVECEYADKTCIVLLLSPVMSEQDFSILEAALDFCTSVPAEVPPALPAPMEQVLPLRTAALSPYESIPLRNAENRICAPVQVPCPPAVPIAVSGEKITRKWLDFMEFYSLHTIAVVKNS